MESIRSISRIPAVLLLGAAFASPAASSPIPIHSDANQVAVVSRVVIAEGISWRGFVRYWRGFVHRADRVVLVVGLVAAAALFIITRGRWLK